MQAAATAIGAVRCRQQQEQERCGAISSRSAAGAGVVWHGQQQQQEQCGAGSSRSGMVQAAAGVVRCG